MPNGKGDRKAQRARYRQRHPERNKGDVAAQQRRYRETHRDAINATRRSSAERKRDGAKDFPFLDGESWNDEKGTARLVYLSCYSPREQRYIRLVNAKGIRTVEALNWMISNLPSVPVKQSRNKSKLIAWYGGGYDLTLILRDLPAWLHFLLIHPEKRRYRDAGDQKKAEVHSVFWKGFRLDWMNNMFRLERDGKCIVIFDIMRYYQCSFLQSLKDWKIGTDEEHEIVKRGKANRSDFSEAQFSEIQAYCDVETKLGAALWQKLREAHEAVDLEPAHWFGPGQTAKALLTKVYAECYGTDRVGPGRGEVRWQRLIRHARLRIPHSAWPAFASAFFGGRFENSRYGAIRQRVWNADIASAYPKALTELPCIVHGEWNHVTAPTLERLRKATLACVHWELPPHPDRETLEWAPLPFRDPDGAICYPVNAKSWAWLPEILAARRLGFKPKLLEAWVFEAKCKCPVYTGRPSIRDYYGQRIRIGKEGPGMVLKFALNSCYGVKAQVLGIHEARSLSPFQSFVEAGMITSLTRARLLGAIVELGPENVVMVNTDSVTSFVEPSMLPQRQTTEKGPDGKSKPELGDWDIDVNEDGVTLVKQGIYFDRAFKKLKARGIGRDVLQRNSVQIERALETWIAGGNPSEGCTCEACTKYAAGRTKVKPGPHIVLNQNRDVFHGHRECTQAPLKLEPEDWEMLAYCAFTGRESKHAPLFKKRDYYGSWEKFEQHITFDSMPKRERVNPDGHLVVRDMGGAESQPYEKALAIAELISEAGFDPLEWELDQPDFLDEAFEFEGG